MYVTKPAPVFTQHVLGIMENLYVHPDFRRRGIGRRLVDSSHRFFELLEVDEIYVNVIPANRLSKQFWSSMGYETKKLTMTRRGL